MTTTLRKVLQKGYKHEKTEILAVVIVLRAVSAPILKSDPGTLFETVAGITTIGIHSSSYLERPSISSRLPVKACKRNTEKRIGKV